MTHFLIKFLQKTTIVAFFDNLIIILYMMLGSVKRFAQAENDDYAIMGRVSHIGKVVLPLNAGMKAGVTTRKGGYCEPIDKTQMPRLL